MKTFFIFLSTFAVCFLTTFSEAYENYSEANGCCFEPSECSQISYGVYGEWLYLQPNGSNLYYGVEAIGLDPDISVPAVSPNWNVLEIDPNYHSGFRVGTKAYFHCNDMSIDLNWERLHAKDRDSFTAPNADGFMVGPFFDIGPNSASYKIARGHATSEFDQVNLNFGKHFCFCNLFANVYGGVAFSRIKQTVHSSYSNVDETISRYVKSPSTFTGGGPQIGLDYDYQIWNNFCFTGSSVASLFIGEMKNSTTFKSFTPELATLGIAQPNVQKTNVSNRTQLVPSFEQKLGFSYCAAFECFQVTLGAGYQWQYYVNAVQTVDMTAPQVLPAGAIFTPQVGVFAVGFERTVSDYMLSGPYVSLNVDF